MPLRGIPSIPEIPVGWNTEEYAGEPADSDSDIFHIFHSDTTRRLLVEVGDSRTDLTAPAQSWMGRLPAAHGDHSQTGQPRTIKRGSRFQGGQRKPEKCWKMINGKQLEHDWPTRACHQLARTENVCLCILYPSTWQPIETTIPRTVLGTPRTSVGNFQSSVDRPGTKIRDSELKACFPH